MRDKILQALRDAGHGLTPNSLARFIAISSEQVCYYSAMLKECKKMEIDKLIILHRSSGSAGIPKGEIVLITLRPEGH